MARPRATEADAEDVIEQDAGEPTIVGVPLMPRSKPAPRVVRVVSNQKMFDDGSVDNALSKLGDDDDNNADEDDRNETVVAAEAPDLDAQETEISKDFESPRAATTALRPAIIKPPAPSTRPVTIPPRPAEPPPRASTPTAPPESRPKTPTAKRASIPSRVSLSVEEQSDEPPTIVRLGQPSVLPEAPPRAMNRTLIAVLATTAVVGGLAIATYALVLKDRPAAVAPSPPPPPPTPVAPVVVPVDAAVAVEPSPPPQTPPATAIASAELTNIEHPVIETLVAPIAGQVTIATVATHAKVGDTVVSLKGKPAANPRIAELETKVKSLEAAAAADPAAPAEELAKARADLAALQQPVVTWVKATKSGSLELRVALHAEIKKGDPLAIVRDDRTWVGVASFTEQPTAMWTCAVSSADTAKTAACRIQATEVVDGATRVTVEIAATPATSWLRDTGARLMLAPPSAR